jgi:hypothetical protein
MWLKIILLASLVIAVNEIVKLISKPFVKKQEQVDSESEEKMAA